MFHISKNQTLSENFIRDFQNEVIWIRICANQKLSNEFIREMHDKVHWLSLCDKQDLPDDMLMEFQHHIRWEEFFHYRAASYPILKKFIAKTSFLNMNEFETKHLSAIQYKEIEKILTLKNIFAETSIK